MKAKKNSGSTKGKSSGKRAVKDLDALKGQDVRGGQAAATLTSSVIKQKEETAVATISNIR